MSGTRVASGLTLYAVVRGSVGVGDAVARTGDLLVVKDSVAVSGKATVISGTYDASWSGRRR